MDRLSDIEKTAQETRVVPLEFGGFDHTFVEISVPGPQEGNKPSGLEEGERSGPARQDMTDLFHKQKDDRSRQNVSPRRRRAGRLRVFSLILLPPDLREWVPKDNPSV